MVSVRRILSIIKNKLRKVFYYYRFSFLSVKYGKIKDRLKNKLGKEPIRVGFLGYLDGPACDVFTELYYKFSNDSRFVCSVITVPYTHDEKGKMIKKQQVAIDYLESKGIKPLPGYDEKNDIYVDYSGLFDLVFFEVEYDWVHPFFKAQHFSQALSFVVPYGQYLANNIAHHLSCEMMSYVYKVFPTSVTVGKMMKKYSEIKGRNICDKYLGNPKTDVFFFPSHHYVDVWKKARSSQKRIIWAPHHTWADYSNFELYSEYFLDYAELHQNDVFIAIKPHPALKDSLKNINKWSDDKIDSYFSRWRNGVNTSLFEGEWYNLFMSSDAMILDSIGFMLEYSLSMKPACVIYRENERGERTMKFSECGEDVYNLLYHAKSQSEIENFLGMIKKGEDPLFERRKLYIENNYLPPYQQSGSENIFNYIVEEIENNER